MGIDNLQQKKQEVATSMFNDFKKELGFFQSTVISFFDKKITQTIISDDQLGNSWTDTKININFIEKLLIKLSPSTADKLFIFIKENQEKLIKANTIEELDNLKKWIVVLPEVKPENQSSPVSEQSTSWESQDIFSNKDEEKEETNQAENNEKKNSIKGASVGIGLGLTAKAIGQVDKIKTANKLRETANIKPEDFIKKFDDVAENLKKEKMNPKLTSFQKKMIDKSIKEFQKISKAVDWGTIDAVKILQKLDKRLPNSLLKSVDPTDAKKLEKLLAKDTKLADMFFSEKKNMQEIQSVLKKNGIKSVNEDVIKAFKLMKTPEELHGAVFVCTELKWIKALTRGLRGVIIFDLILWGVDIRNMQDGLDESELYKKVNQLRASTMKEHALVQFSAATALTVLNIIITCSSLWSVWWPIGFLIGAWLWGITAAISNTIDIFYDAVEFYQQKQQDFQKQYRTEIKQAIIQSSATQERNLNLASAGYAETKNGNKPITTTKEARQALIWQEEYEKFPLIAEEFFTGKSGDDYLNTLDGTKQAEYKKQQKELDSIIAKRMEYIQAYVYEKKGTSEYNNFVSAMKNNLGIKAIEKILTESKTYYTLGLRWPEQYITGAKNIQEYKKLFWEKLKSESPKGFATLEKMWATQPYMVLELYQWIKNTEHMFIESWKSPEYIYKDKIDTMKKNTELIKRYYEYKSIDLSREEQINLDISFRALDAVMIEKILIQGDFENTWALSRNATQAKTYFVQDLVQDRRDTKIEYSDKVGQNIIYRIAKEIHGYAWTNTISALIDFFRPEKADALWLYYDNGWKINNNNAIDKKISIEEMENMSSEEIMKMRVGSSKWNILLSAIDPGKSSIFGQMGLISGFGFTDDAAFLDTKADAGDMDKKMNNEYTSRLAKIIYEEKSYTNPKIKKEIELKIIEYIKKYSQPISIDIENNETTKTEQWYIEMPYNLIIAAKKAHIGNIEKFLFKIENNQIVACTSRLRINEPLYFTQTNTVIHKEYVNLWTQVDYKQAMPYINYVDKAKDTFESFIKFDNNELDLPSEYIIKYQAKIDERTQFKMSLVNMDPSTASTKLLGKYKEFHDRFENMYIAMLAKISQFKSSNDLDSASYLQEVESRVAQLDAITIKNGLIIGSMDVLSEMQRKIFLQILTTWKPRGKDIILLAKSWEKTDQDKAIWAVKQITKSMIESQVLYFNTEGKTIGIGHGEDNNLIEQKKVITQRLTINGNITNYFVWQELSNPQIDFSKTTIVPIK